MKITRGPANGEDEEYILVDTLSTDKIEKYTSKGFLHFNITKNVKQKQRASACYVEFEKSDLLPLFKGLATWVDPELDGFFKIKSVMRKDISGDEKLKEIQSIISNVRMPY